MLTVDKLTAFFKSEFPHADFVIEALSEKSATIRQKIGREHLRPGGTVSGPVLMALADAALYVTILADIGLVALAVTTNLNINFLRKPAADKDLIAVCRMIKMGKALAVGEVSIYSDGMPDVVAHAVGTYAIPSEKPSKISS